VWFSARSCGIFNHVININVTWIHIYDLETKEQSKKWRYSGSLRAKKFKTQKSSSKVFASVF
jgi:hypothetical protein